MVNTIIECFGGNVKPEWGCSQGRKSDVATKWEADMSLVQKDLNWTPKFNLADGIKKTIEWFRENMELY